MSSLPSQGIFKGPISHKDNLGSSKILSPPDIQNITILEARVLSADTVYSTVKAGKTVMDH